MTVIVALADLVGSAWLVAVTVQVPAVAGAVNKPEGEIVPPEADQVTDVSVVLATLAVNCHVAPVSREALVGAILMVTAGGGGGGAGGAGVITKLHTCWLPISEVVDQLLSREVVLRSVRKAKFAAIWTSGAAPGGLT